MKATRREFVSTMALAALGARYVRAAAARLPLAFSTLGCPGWTWPQILEFAEQHEFAAVELRGLLGDMNLPARPEFAADKIPAAKRHVADPQKRAQQLSDARGFIDLASALGAPYVRVFGNKMEGPREEVIARVSSGLHELGEYSGPRNVTVIMESHGDFTDSATLKER